MWLIIGWIDYLVDHRGGRSRFFFHPINVVVVTVNAITSSCFCVTYTNYVAILWHPCIYLFVHENQMPVTWLAKHVHIADVFFFFHLFLF